MKIAIWQGASTAADALETWARVAPAARARGADLVVLPEMFATGYAIGAETVARLAQPHDGPWARDMGAISAAHAVAVAYGYPERGNDGRIYNAARLIDASGTGVLRYRKRQLFGELDRAMFSAGDAPSGLAAIAGMKVGLLICYDVEFPEMVRALAIAGADLVAVPTALMHPFTACATILVPARAIESQVFVAYANRCGSEGDLHYCGLSCVAAPDGAVAARAGDSEKLIVVELDADALARSRAAMPYLLDRRADLYDAAFGFSQNASRLVSHGSRK